MRPEKDTLQKSADLVAVGSDIDTELEPSLGQIKIHQDGTAESMSDDPVEIAKIKIWRRGWTCRPDLITWRWPGVDGRD